MSDLPRSNDFPVTFEDPADAEKSWQHDPVHTPGAIPPLNFELGLGPFIEGFGWGMQPLQMNYYPFYSFGQRPAEQEGVPKSNEPEELKKAGQRWRELVLPEAIELAEHYRTTIRSLEQSDRLRPGDVLVCPVTQPPWTPLFGVACAIVTEVGSVLGHTAIVARMGSPR